MTSFAELLKQKKQDLASRNRAKTAKVPDGRSRWRILPSWRGGDAQFWHDFGAHYVKNTKGEMQAVYMCVDKTFGRPCEICDAVAHAIKHATDDATMEALTQAKANGRVLLNAIQLDGPGADVNKVVILELPPSAFGLIVDIANEWIGDDVNILDVVDGKDLVIERSGTGKNTKYSIQVGAKATKLPADVLKQLHDLDAYVAQESSDQQARALNAVRSTAGLLPAPTGAAAALAAPKGSALPAGATIVEDDYEVAVPPSKRAAAAAQVEDAKPVTRAAAPAPAPATSSGDDDLDAMLAELDGN